MREDDIRSLLKDMTNNQNLRMQTISSWVMCTCPLAPWTHEKGSDTKPSFGVSIHDDDTSIFNCFTCGEKGPMSYFVQLMGDYTGTDYDSLIESLELDELYAAELPEWDTCRQLQKNQKPEPLPKHFEDLYEPMEEVHPYLKERGIKEPDVIQTCRLCVDPDDQGVERIVFPVYGLDGNLYGFTGRATSDIVQPKVKDYFGLPKKDLLLGLHNVGPDTERVIIVEGLFDYLNLCQFGYTALAVMHSGLTDPQAKLVREIGKPTYLMYDDDLAGRKGTKQATELLKGFVPTMLCEYPEPEDDDEEAPTDPAELYRKEVVWMLSNAEMA